MISLIQHFEADFLWKVSLKILNSEIILKTFTDDTGKIFMLFMTFFKISFFKKIFQDHYQSVK